MSGPAATTAWKSRCSSGAHSDQSISGASGEMLASQAGLYWPVQKYSMTDSSGPAGNRVPWAKPGDYPFDPKKGTLWNTENSGRAFDEINRLARDPALWEHLIMIARQARHQGLTLWLSGQDLLTVPDELLGLATQRLQVFLPLCRSPGHECQLPTC